MGKQNSITDYGPDPAVITHTKHSMKTNGSAGVIQEQQPPRETGKKHCILQRYIVKDP